MSACRERRAALSRRLDSPEADNAAGYITATQLRTATAEVDALNARMAKTLRRSVSSEILPAADPGAAFLDAAVGVQRAVLATVLRFEVARQARRGPSGPPPASG